MHGYFMDIRLYHKVTCVLPLTGETCCESVSKCSDLTVWFWLQVKSLANPFAYEEYRKDKIRQKIEESRTQRVQVKVRGPDTMSHLSSSGYSFRRTAQMSDPEKHVCIKEIIMKITIF